MWVVRCVWAMTIANPPLRFESWTVAMCVRVPCLGTDSDAPCNYHAHSHRNSAHRTSRSRKPIPELTLADHDASQTTLEDYYPVQHSQTTPVSTYPPHKMTPDIRDWVWSCLFPSSPDECNAEVFASTLATFCINPVINVRVCLLLHFISDPMTLRYLVSICVLSTSLLTLQQLQQFTEFLKCSALFCVVHYL